MQRMNVWVSICDFAFAFAFCFFSKSRAHVKFSVSPSFSFYQIYSLCNCVIFFRINSRFFSYNARELLFIKLSCCSDMNKQNFLLLLFIHNTHKHTYSKHAWMEQKIFSFYSLLAAIFSFFAHTEIFPSALMKCHGQKSIS